MELVTRFPEFETGARYVAIDGQAPGFAAIYQVSSLGLFGQPRYQSLRANRSAREAELFTRLGTIDRRTYRCILQVQRKTSSSDHQTYHSHILTVELAEPSPELLSEIHLLDGWRKTHVGETVDSSIVGRLQSASSDPFRTPRFILIFEFANLDFQRSEQLARLTNNPEASQTLIRKWMLYRGWKNSCNMNPGSAQAN
ncbi:hypothetical protein PGTUg99_010189 [Puccinia graminis f. sp. tritici]|uniref:Uncharacterized protein n=1 Tax=Puccinia graminis f. sp. tritici TaxID=56615 RepID=A0A5B0NSQ0_PUCGR|nr:hypothetical protein PGTUg99_010189 [Puccinia graminis f. sp. tritici]